MRPQVNELSRAFGQGIDAIEIAYTATIAAVEARHAAAVVKANELRDAKSRGETWKLRRMTRDGPRGHPEMRLRLAVMDEADSRDAVVVARNAYAVMLHHHWETHCDRWMASKSNYSASKAYEWLESHGIQVDRHGLEFVRKVANTIKHNNDALVQTRPELFDQEILQRSRKACGAALRLSDADFRRMIDIVGTSGPDPRSEFPYGAVTRSALLDGSSPARFIIMPYPKYFR